ncbi:cupin domain-containing protein [Microbulbifer thermotolerans]|uniref:Cupin n=1 Tax=Microbulbifer thermotolerans TaxID=252514 RepID=A0A143HHP5_MICTH|nr:cupin domain-containing protein [Microbulbifer thermotolerans]AMX01245.1 cupin [Microbulbifer thermotolerans]MCX2778429.1 cupin domain-containing protein [Microbulbifer thermotolerans]MCX2783900.1 cupin domain-containing protein [Microbulbifer thermotolerans]MCX2793913.1 cupin domain-containing protein [Microbulbifer thermotolerans]MCX2802505.1 cupin domain-containing protein [Microbulbifer thermotolerans]
MPASDAFVLSEKIEVEDLGGGVKRQILGYDDNLMVVKVWFEEGSIGYVHKHPHTQVTYVESGEFEVQIDGQKQILRAGDSFYIAPHLEHGAVCRKAGVLIDTFTPHREDFLKA